MGTRSCSPSCSTRSKLSPTWDFLPTLLTVGLFTRITGLLLAGEMAVALVKVHGILANPMAVHNYEFPLAMAVGSFALAALGAGLISLDHAIFAKQRNFPKKPKGRDKRD